MYADTLQPNDLIQMGSALVLFLADYGEEIPPQPTTPAAVEGVPIARLRIIHGPRSGTPFFLSSRPVLLGRHPLAGIRVEDPSVSPFHAHLAYTVHGFRLLDLKSATGTRVNGLAVTHQILKEEDNVSIGPCTFSFHLLGPADLAGKAGARPRAVPTGRPAEARSAENEEADYDIPIDAEVEPSTDLMVKMGLKPPRDIPQPRRPSKAYKPGQLQLTCVEGPSEGKSFVVAKPSTFIGRDRSVEILLEDPSVSRRHAEVVLGSAQSEIRDLGSRNGVFVNGTRVSRAGLCSGDTVRIGKCLLIAEEVPPAAKARK